MELLYIWINEYKCIHRQGFCLSSEFNVEIIEDGEAHYRLKIQENGKTNVFRDGPVVNLTVLVGENGSGKTTFLEYVQELQCFSQNIFQKDNEEYSALFKQQTEESRNVIVLKDGVTIQIYTNLPEWMIDLDEEKMKHYQIQLVNLCSDGECARDMLMYSKAFYGITSFYLTNSSYHLLGGSSSYEGLKKLVFSPVSLNSISDAFFGCICPETRMPDDNERSQLLWCYSSFLKKRKEPGEFQQMCDILFYERLLETGAFKMYAGFVQTDLIVKIYSVYQIFHKNGQVAREGNDLDELYIKVRERFEKLNQFYNRTLAKQSPIYILKANFIAEYSLAHEEILNESEHRSPLDLTVEGVQGLQSSTEWVEIVFEELDKRFNVEAEQKNYTKEDIYFMESYREIQQFCQLLKELEPCKNLVPVDDMSYKTGVHMTMNLEDKNIKESSFMKICRFLAERIRENIQVRAGKKLYGSIVLRYIAIGNLIFSSGERAFQNLMSWMAFGAELSNVVGTGEYVPKRNILLCMDEIDLYCHPAWQRDFIDNMLQIIKQAYMEYSVQVILTTHSPLCLSDVPQENIIYLKKENGKTVVDKSEHRQTFACNLYELLNDAFYLGNETMGRFAKTYVDSLIRDIDTLEDWQENGFEETRRKINRIGDHFLRRKLEQQLERKWRTKVSHRQQIRQLEADKQRIERLLQELKGQE